MAVIVVSYRNSTSNHNPETTASTGWTLYLIEILHQTTTNPEKFLQYYCCILSKFYIKPQQMIERGDKREGCILSKFYIKPQLRLERELAHCVVSYRNSTSNHNNARRQWRFQQLYLIEILHQTTTIVTATMPLVLLYLIEILHQTTTEPSDFDKGESCILSKFYIKPQLRLERELARCVVSYRNSTSNHNK